MAQLAAAFNKMSVELQDERNRIEKYPHEHSDARLSHGICPECARKHFPEMDLENET